MNKKDNQRTRLSKMLLKNAMLTLLKEKRTVNKITVRELCTAAELNRSTFYAHYNEPKDLLDEITAQLLGDIAAYLKEIGEGNDTDAYKAVAKFLKYIRQNDMEFRTLLVDSTDTDFKNQFMQVSVNEIIRSFDISLAADEEQYVYSYILNGSTNVIMQWIRSGYSVEESKLVELLFRMNKKLLEGVVIG